MALFITENDVKQLEQFAALSAANKLKIKDAEWKTSTELVELISQIKPELAASLEAFILAYRNWYNFHVQIDKAGKQGNLNQKETEELNQLMERRDDTRNVLIKSLANVI